MTAAPRTLLGAITVTGPTRIDFNLTTPLAGGTHTVTVTNPNGQSSAAFPFTVASSAPTINRPRAAPPASSTPSSMEGALTINGSNLQSGATVSLGNAATGTHPGPFSGTGQGSQIVSTLPAPVPPGATSSHSRTRTSSR